MVMEGVADPDSLMWLVVLGGLSMAFMAWGIGANDVANSFGPAFGAKAISVKTACCLAGVFEAAGAIFMGSHVSDTIRKGMMSVELYSGDEGRTLIMVGMTSVLLAAATWLLVASKLGLPVSTTHAAVGGVVAFAIASKGYGAVTWSKVGMIVASWFASPASSIVVSFCVYKGIYHGILKHRDSRQRALMSAPFFIFIVAFIVTLFTIYKGGKGLGLNEATPAVAIGGAAGIAIFLAAVSYPLVRRWAAGVVEKEASTDGQESIEVPKGDAEAPVEQAEPKNTSGDEQAEPKKTSGDEQVSASNETAISSTPSSAEGSDDKLLPVDPMTDQLFKGLTVIMAAFFSLAHGANDVANSVGPFAAVLAAFNGPVEAKSETPVWVFCVAGVMIVVGLATYGVHVMQTIGGKITPITPPKAFCVNFSATLVVLVATRIGLPISTTHASVGAVVGVGLAEGAGSVSWTTMLKVASAWVFTLPIVGITACGIFAFLLPCVVDVPLN